MSPLNALIDLGLGSVALAALFAGISAPAILFDAGPKSLAAKIWLGYGLLTWLVLGLWFVVSVGEAIGRLSI